MKYEESESKFLESVPASFLHPSCIQSVFSILTKWVPRT